MQPFQDTNRLSIGDEFKALELSWIAQVIRIAQKKNLTKHPMPCLSPSWASHNASIIASGEKCLITFQTHRQTSSLSRTGKTSISYSNDQQPKKTSTENLHTFHKNQRNHVWFECDIALTANEVEKKTQNFQTRSKIQTFDFYFFRKNWNSSCESQTHAGSPTFGFVSHQRQTQWIVVAGRKTSNLRLGIGGERRR